MARCSDRFIRGGYEPLGAYGGLAKKKYYTFRDVDLDSDGNVKSEKLVYFKTKGKEKLLYDQAVEEPLIDGQLTVYGHANSKFIQFEMKSLFQSDHLKATDSYLYNDSTMYKNAVDNMSILTINFKACDTGKGATNISQQLTDYRSNLIIHAAASYWLYNGNILRNAGYNMFINGSNVGWDLKR